MSEDRIATFSYRDPSGRADLDVEEIANRIRPALSDGLRGGVLGESVVDDAGPALAVTAEGTTFSVSVLDPQTAELLGRFGLGGDEWPPGTVVVPTSGAQADVDQVEIRAGDRVIAVLPAISARIPSEIAFDSVLSSFTYQAAIDAASAADLGLRVDTVTAIVGRPPGSDSEEVDPVSAEERDAVQAAFEAAVDAPVSAPPEGREVTIGAVRDALIVAGLLLALGALGVAIVLTAVESRRERAVLDIMGMDPRNRRSLAAARAGLLATLGSWLGIPAGIAPVYMMARAAATDSSTLNDVFTIDVGVLILVGLVFPMLAVAVTWCWPLRHTTPSDFRLPT